MSNARSVDPPAPYGRYPTTPWPAEFASAYRAQGCWAGELIGSWPWQWADRWGKRTALVDGDRHINYRELAQRVDVLAQGLAAQGLGHGDAAIVQLPNCWEFVVCVFACARLGVAPVLMLPAHRDYEMAAIAAHVAARAIIVPDRWRGYDHQALATRVVASLDSHAVVFVAGEDVRDGSVALRPLMNRAIHNSSLRQRLNKVAPDPGEILLYLLSGGTTGIPKLIGRTHDDYAYNVRCCAEACGIDEKTVYLLTLPVGHNFPLANPGLLGTFLQGGRVVLQSSPRAESALATIEAERVTATAVVPAVALAWIEHLEARARDGVVTPDLSSLELLHIGGSMLAPEAAARIGASLGCGIQQVYGMAEGLICYTRRADPAEVVNGTQGCPISHYDELRVVDELDREVPAGTVGELLTRGPYTPRGYYDAPEQNRLSFTADGWFRTGDLVVIRPDGNLVVCGRIKDLINRGGEKISAAEVEGLLHEIPQIAEVAVVGMPDPEVGERVWAFVRLYDGPAITLPDVVAALTDRGLAAFKIPERLLVVYEIPKTPVGKPDTKQLRQLFSDID